MLRITLSHSGEALVAYFNDDLIKDGNYFLDKEREVFFEGEAAKHLELDGKLVTPGLFYKLAHNIDPNSAKDNTLTVRNATNRRSGFDFTFSASKSVSIVHAITKDPDVLKAHQFAYRKAMEYVEKHALTQANTQYGRFYEQTGNIIMMAFDHFTSRPVEGVVNGRKTFVSDCQLHTHCIVPNITWNPSKRRFQALEMGKIHELAPYVEEIYHSHLSYRLGQSGYAIKRTKDRYEIEGVSKAIINRFSNRTAQIEEIARARNITDPIAKSKIGAYSRASKNQADQHLDLDILWNERLSDQELNQLRSVKGKPREAKKSVTAKEAVDQALTHHLQRNSTAKEKLILAYALKLGYGRLLPKDVSIELNGRENVLQSEVDMISQITTRELVYEEERMIKMALNGKGKSSPLNQDYVPKQEFLNDQQRTAIAQILNSNAQTSILRGAAGVGKTSLLVEVKNAVEQTGKSFFAVAPSAQASRGVMRQKGFEADTVAALLHNPKLQQEKLPNGCLLVDEAGTLGVKNMTQLLALAEQYKTRVILSGDIKQHGPPGQYGDALRILQDKAKLETASVQKIVRQKQEDLKKAVEQLAKAKPLKAYRTLDQMKAIQEIPDQDQRLKAIARDYTKSVKAKRSALIISPTNAEGDLIANTVREQLKKERLITGKERGFDVLRSLVLTSAEKQDLIQYEKGQIVRFVKNQKGGIKAGNHYEVNSIKPDGKIKINDLKSGERFTLPIKTPEHFQLYEKQRINLAKGDMIRMTNNLKSVEQTKVNNGTNYRVMGFTRDGSIKLSNGKSLSKDAMHFKQGYVETSHSSQGKDCQDVFISMSDMSFSASNAQQFYVSVSRGIHSAKIYTNDKQQMKKVIARSTERLTARQVAEGHHRRLMNQKQKAHHQDLNKKQRNYGPGRYQQPAIEPSVFRHGGRKNYDRE